MESYCVVKGIGSARACLIITSVRIPHTPVHTFRLCPPRGQQRVRSAGPRDWAFLCLPVCLPGQKGVTPSLPWLQCPDTPRFSGSLLSSKVENNHSVGK